MSQYRINQLVRIRHLQNSHSIDGHYIHPTALRNCGKIAIVRRVITSTRGATVYGLANPRTRRLYAYYYPHGALIGLHIYTRHHT